MRTVKRSPSWPNRAKWSLLRSPRGAPPGASPTISYGPVSETEKRQKNGPDFQNTFGHVFEVFCPKRALGAGKNANDMLWESCHKKCLVFGASSQKILRLFYEELGPLTFEKRNYVMQHLEAVQRHSDGNSLENYCRTVGAHAFKGLAG